MRRFLSVVLSAVAASAFVVALSAPASAAPPWTISPGGSFVATSTGAVRFVTSRNVTLSCTSSRLTGALDVGSSADNALGRISGGSFTGCALAGLFPVSLTLLNLPWSLNGNPTTSTASVVVGSITGIRIQVTGSGCSFIIAGSSASTPGQANFTYTNGTGSLTFRQGNLRIWNVVGCGGLVVNGDSVTFQATYVLSPGQTIVP